MTNEKFWTIPNVLSSYRIVIFPLIVYFIATENENMFVIFLVINLISDILDGLIARVFNMRTAIGAKLDSIGDVGTYICAFAGVRVFKWEEFQGHLWPLFIFLALYILMHVVALLKFKRMPSLHLYSFKTTGYLQGIFFAILFLYDFVPWYYYLALGFGILATIEEILVLFALKEPQSDVKGLYWVLKNNKK